MTSERPEFVKCIKSTKLYSLATMCGRRPDPGEFLLEDVEHACSLVDSRLLVCPDCVEFVVTTLKSVKF